MTSASNAEPGAILSISTDDVDGTIVVSGEINGLEDGDTILLTDAAGQTICEEKTAGSPFFLIRFPLDALKGRPSPLNAFLRHRNNELAKLAKPFPADCFAWMN